MTASNRSMTTKPASQPKPAPVAKKNGAFIPLDLPNEQWEQIDEVAALLGTNRDAVLNNILRLYLPILVAKHKGPEAAPAVEPDADAFVEGTFIVNGKLVVTLTPRGSYKAQGVASLCQMDTRAWMESTLNAAVRADIEGEFNEVTGN